MTGSINLIDALYSARPPDAPLFLSDSAADLSTSAAMDLIARLGTCLRACGVNPGDRVSVKLPKSVDAILAAHAVIAMGAVLHPLNDSYTNTEVAALLADAQPTLLLADPSEMDRMSSLAKVAGARLETLMPGSGSLLQCQSGPALSFRAILYDGSEDAALLYTSGTTGKPKGARITHRNLISSASALAEIWALGPGDVLLHALPVYHAHGLLTSINTMLASGGAVRLLPGFDIDRVLAALSQTTLMMGVPTYYARMLADSRLPEALGQRFRFAISGSSPLPVALAREFSETAGVPLLERYGSTETAIVVAVPPDSAERSGWVGWPLPGVEIRLRGTDGACLAQGTGELETRGDNVFAGYWRNDTANRDAFSPDGWFRTGDIAEIAEDGCVRLLGRLKEIVITGGLNVYPAEVENALASLSGVTAAAVFGVPHPDFGEAVVAVVERAPGTQWDEAAAIAELRQDLAGYKTPKRILIADIPRNAMGKTLKPALSRTYAGLFQGGQQQQIEQNRKKV